MDETRTRPPRWFQWEPLWWALQWSGLMIMATEAEFRAHLMRYALMVGLAERLAQPRNGIGDE